MELIAEHEATRARAAFEPVPPPQGPPRRSSTHGRRLLPLRHRPPQRGASEDEPNGSDGECHGEDDEVGARRPLDPPLSPICLPLSRPIPHPIPLRPRPKLQRCPHTLMVTAKARTEGRSPLSTPALRALSAHKP